MRNLKLLDKYRCSDKGVIAYYGWDGDDTCGVFAVPSPIDGGMLRIIASAGGNWEHVSVSRKNRCPNWPEMSHIKGLFFRDTETVMQLHVPTADHVNDHPNCLHLWRPIFQEIPRPPGWMVGGVDPDEADRLAKAAGA
jgi:hypothetical protein